MSAPKRAIAAAFFGGLAVGFCTVVIQEHHGSPWASVVASAPVTIVARLIFDQVEVYAWSKIIGTALLYALYAGWLAGSRSTARWASILAVHAACAVFVALSRNY